MDKYSKCRECHFLVTIKDEYCHNCGIIAPHPDHELHTNLSKKELNYSKYYAPINLLNITVPIVCGLIGIGLSTFLNDEIKLLGLLIILYPLIRLFPKIIKWLKKSNIFIMLLGIISYITFILVALGQYAAFSEKSPENPVISLILGFSIGLINARLLSSSNSKIAQKLAAKKIIQKPESVDNVLEKRASTYLRHDGKMIRQRLNEIDGRKEKIFKVIQEIQQEKDQNYYQSMVLQLENGMNILNRQYERYQIKFWELELVRWKNSLEPFISEETSVTEEGYQKQLSWLDKSQARGNEMLRKWKLSELKNSTDGQQCINCLTQTLQTCELIRKDLRAKQSAIILRGISNFEQETEKSFFPNKTLLELDAFNILPGIDIFSSGFKELEHEYIRLQIEQEIS